MDSVGMIEVDLVLTDLDKAGKDGRVPIYLKFKAPSSKAKYLHTNRHTLPAEFKKTKKQYVPSRTREGKNTNLYLQALIAKADQVVLSAFFKGEALSYTEFKKRLLNKGNAPIVVVPAVAWIDAKIKKELRFGKITDTTAETYGYALKALKEIVAFKPFDKIDVDDIYGIKKIKSDGTAYQYWNILERFFSEAQLEGFELKFNPKYIKFIKPGVQKERIPLDLSELKLLEEVALKKRNVKLKKEEIKWVQCFCFMAYANGIAFSDMFSLQRNMIVTHGKGRYGISRNRGKTKKSIARPIMDAALEFLPDDWKKLAESDFIFFTDESIDRSDKDIRRAWTLRMNKALKKAALKVGIDKNISSHIARHTFADLAAMSGIDLSGISEILGHANIQTTRNYRRYRKEKLILIIENKLNEMRNKITYSKTALEANKAAQEQMSNLLVEESTTQAELATKMGVDESAVSRWINPNQPLECKMTILTLAEMANQMGKKVKIEFV